MISAVALVLCSRAQIPIAETDFELSNSHIHVSGTVNGHKADIVVDTGAAMAIMDLSLANQWKLDETGDLQVGGIGQERVHGKLLPSATVEIAGIKTPVKIALPLGSIAKLGGRPLQVVIGYEFLKEHILEVDYPNRHLRIFDAKADLPSKGVSMPARIVGGHVHLTTELTIQGKAYSLETVIDTGAAGDGGLSAKFLASHPLNVTKTPESVIGGGVGGDLIGSFMRPDSLRIGGVSLSGPVISLASAGQGASGSGSTYDLLVGGDVLRRFRVTIDYPHSRMILEPGSEISKPFEADKTGLRVLAEGADFRTFRVAGVLAGSSSSSSGIKVGDVIDSIDGRGAGGLTLQEIRDEFRSGSAKGWNLGILRDGGHIMVHVVAKSII